MGWNWCKTLFNHSELQGQGRNSGNVSDMIVTNTNQMQNWETTNFQPINILTHINSQTLLGEIKENYPTSWLMSVLCLCKSHEVTCLSAIMRQRVNSQVTTCVMRTYDVYYLGTVGGILKSNNTNSCFYLAYRINGNTWRNTQIIWWEIKKNLVVDSLCRIDKTITFNYSTLD